MGIFGFLFGLGCLVVIAWAIALLGDLVFGRKHRQRKRPQEQPLPKPTQFKECFGSPQPPIAAPQEQPSLKPTQFRERFGSSQPPIAAPPISTVSHRRIVAPQEQPSSKPTQFRERLGSPQPTITAPSTPRVPRRQVVALRQSPVSTRVRLPSNRHQQYIQLADSVLKRLRDRIPL